jgi:hypothetical protein
VDDADLMPLLVEGERTSGRVLGDCPADLEDDSAHLSSKYTSTTVAIPSPRPTCAGAAHDG